MLPKVAATGVTPGTMGRMTRQAWLDVSAGVAGDMLLGACIDAGADLAEVEAVVRRVVGPAVGLHAETVTRAGQRAVKVTVTLDRNTHHRTWHSIRTELEGADIPDRTRDLALAAFATLADAEGHVHGIDPEDIHFHEAGGLDSIADVVGTCEALRQLGVTSVTASPVALGEGRIRAAHGDIPVPVPAVAQLAIGWQVAAAPGHDGEAHGHADHRDGEAHGHAAPHDHPQGHGHDHAEDHDGADDHHHVEGPAVVTTPGMVGELATPTGMALVRSLATACGPLPPMTLAAVGVGAGGKDFATHPNVVRLLLGSPTAADQSPGQDGALRELRANVDDMDPRLWPGVLEVLLAAGAADAWLAPILMKKGRPAHCLHALADPSHAGDVTEAMLRHTSTLGVRSTPVGRTVLERAFAAVPVAEGTVAIKVGHRDGVVVNVAAEFESLRDLAGRSGASELDLLTRAMGAATAAGLVPGSRLEGAPVEDRPAGAT